MTLHTLRSRLSALAIGVLIIGLAGCSSDDGATPNPTTEPPRTPETPVLSDEEITMIVLDKYDRFWEALQLSEQGNSDIALFDGLAHGQILNEFVQTAREREASGEPRLGEPIWVTEPEVVIDEDGQGADVLACIDRGKWVPEHVEPSTEILQYRVTFMPVYDEWVVVWTETDADACADS